MKNIHDGRYDFEALCKNNPSLIDHVILNPRGEQTIDFSNPAAVMSLNKALLSQYYNIKNWQIPKGYLCPPVPGRADYIRHLSDLLAQGGDGKIPTGKKIRVLDIGTGASCIYPIIGSRSYGWKFTGTEIDITAVKSARQIIENNPGLNKLIKIVQQGDKKSIFKGIIRENDTYDLSMCNPPFHKSLAAAEAGNKRKWKNLNKSTPDSMFNFGGTESELFCPGGEIAFIAQMVNESCEFKSQVKWFTSLVSKGENIQPIKKLLTDSGATEIRIINMEKGQKISRIIVWSFTAATKPEFD